MTTAAPTVVLFDGVCNLCHRSVQFIVKRDPGRRFRFAALQSERGRQLLTRHGLPPEGLESLVLIDGGLSYTKSDAALRIAGRLPAPWPILATALVIPRPLRDGLYGVIARNRYRWFGRKDSCLVPSGDLADRFLG